MSAKTDLTFNRTLPLVAAIHHPASGRQMKVYTDQPGFQFYTGNFLPDDGSLIGKGGQAYGQHGGLCVETQNFPDAINQPNFPDSVLLPGSVYQRTAVYQFRTIQWKTFLFLFRLEFPEIYFHTGTIMSIKVSLIELKEGSCDPDCSGCRKTVDLASSVEQKESHICYLKLLH